ncbi:hypothetical protein FH972_005270 [Carpinus fangiana]|uniref:Uncharacterized protein n=1 Tax=Carpinus fangiana TaxID=176857 RepID=A0A5N6QP46_9ROSI|nr:hypothetical protein FH972_005270 [Carpinus fangiana]
MARFCYANWSGDDQLHSDGGGLVERGSEIRPKSFRQKSPKALDKASPPGVSPLGPDIQAVLYELCADGQKPVPAVFVGGKFLGGVETLMACHINGSLVPFLKDVGAL